MSFADRIAALEAELVALKREVSRPGSADAAAEAIDRRALFRRGATVAGATSAALLLGQRPARAIDGQPVLIGQNNEGTAQTTISGNTPKKAPFAVKNTSNPAKGGEGPSNPALALGATFTPPGVDNGDSGSLMSLVTDVDNGFCDLLFAHSGPDKKQPSTYGRVYTSLTANFLSFVPPVRAVDTRKVGGRLVAKQARVITLTAATIPEASRAPASAVGVVCNLTAVDPAGSGWVRAWTGTEPATSNVNYTNGQTVANFALLSLSELQTFSVKSLKATHLLVDVFAYVVAE